MQTIILIDLQNDFLPGGSLAVPQGDVLIPIANQIQTQFKLVVATQDWHPANHSSFAVNHPGRQVGEIVQLKKQPQLLWPAHCVQGTRGAEFAPGLVRTRINKVFKKGMDADVDSYSAFFDNQHQRATGLSEYLKEKKVTDVYLLGVATDYCVRFTALDAMMLGFRTFLIEDACRGLNLKPDDVAHALEEMRQAGVSFVRSREIERF